jgi:hypothetical protein
MKRIFIFSTQLGSVDLNEFTEWIENLPSDVELRTSGSHGLDSIAVKANCRKEVFIPWQNFNNYRTLSGDKNLKIRCPAVTAASLAILESCVLGELKEKYKKIDNRLVYGILGKDLKSHVDAVIINNVDSSEMPTTSSALVERIAENADIPTYNLDYLSISELKSLLGI